MFGTMQFYLFVVLAIFLIGDVVGVFTKGKLSGMMITMLIFLVGFLSGVIPPDVIDKAGLTVIAKWTPAMIIFNLGSGSNVKQLIQEWRTVLMACICMVFSIAIIFCTAPIIGLDSVFVAIQKGITVAAALAAVIYALQKLVGAPLASYYGVKEANRLMEEFRKDPAAHMAALHAVPGTEAGAAKVPFHQRYKAYYTPTTMIGITAFFAWVSTSLGTLTGINYGIWALILGSVCNLLGIVPPKVMDLAKSTGILMIAMFGSIIPALAKVSMGDLTTLLFQVVVVFAAAVLGIYLAGYILPTWKLCGSRNLAIGIGVEQFLGFPTNVVIVREIATTVGKTEAESEYIEAKLGTPYVVAGFATVTVVSVLLAGVFVELL
jgi:hypothetical protein